MEATAASVHPIAVTASPPAAAAAAVAAAALPPSWCRGLRESILSRGLRMRHSLGAVEKKEVVAEEMEAAPAESGVGEASERSWRAAAAAAAATSVKGVDGMGV
jgi:hypothetical protein